MALIKNMMKIILLVIAFTTITGAYSVQNSSLSSNAMGENIKPITCPIHFSKEANFISIISIYHTLNDPISRQFVLNFKPYATSFQEFERTYLTFTIDMTCVANSNAIFGGSVKNKFGIKPIPTFFFADTSPVIYDTLIDISDAKWGRYNVKVNIELGFQRENTNLFILPRMTAELVGHGFYEKDLSVHLDIRSITFNSNRIYAD